MGKIQGTSCVLSNRAGRNRWNSILNSDLTQEGSATTYCFSSLAALNSAPKNCSSTNVTGIISQSAVSGPRDEARKDSGFVGSEEARVRASLRPPLKLHVQFSRMQLSRRHITLRCKKRAAARKQYQEPTAKWTFLTPVRLIPASSILGR